jgi:hypothetical protein
MCNCACLPHLNFVGKAEFTHCSTRFGWALPSFGESQRRERQMVKKAILTLMFAAALLWPATDVLAGHGGGHGGGGHGGGHH